MILLKAVVTALLGSFLVHSQAHSIPRNDPCQPSPCGPNAACKINRENYATCECFPNYVGAPPSCQPECIMNKNCTTQMACINLRCKDPCPGTCGLNAVCETIDHNPTCSCSEGHAGDPFIQCLPVTQETSELPVGEPLECLQDSDCSNKRSCINKRCSDPCLGACGLHANCNVINHRPICSCGNGLTGDPFKECRLLPPGTPTPVKNSSDCERQSDCPNQLACINKRCRDPCPGVCGLKATCYTINHSPICRCSDGLTGDAFTECTLLPVTLKPESLTENGNTSCSIHKDCPDHLECFDKKCSDPCNPFGLCGLNASCEVSNHLPRCKCPEGHQGNPFIECEPIPSGSPCSTNKECPDHLECVDQLCRSPCSRLHGLCGLNALCQVDNHVPTCKCLPSHFGDPFFFCKLLSSTTPAPSTPPADVVRDPCVPFPCGPNARCNNGVCTNITEYVGVPHESCVLECDLSSDCPLERACLRNRCSDPCPGACGDNAQCSVVNHTPVCACPQGYNGDAFVACSKIVKRAPYSVINPCSPSPCGPNAICKEYSSSPACSCLKGFVGSPPSCRAECKVKTDCPQTKTCVNQQCVDPCLRACGTGAHCEVINHGAICSCPAGKSGNPCRSCSDMPSSSSRQDPCYPSPCGPNSRCQTISDRAICSCFPNFIGSPPNCRPECVIHKDCPKELACINQRCRDPCPGTCGINATCLTFNHNPICSCKDGHNGDPIIQCRPVTEDTTTSASSAPSVCVSSKDCPPEKACLRSECGDPCPGACGKNAKCSVESHNPICNCQEGYNGDPFVACGRVEDERYAHSEVDPCVPSPCGPNSLCRIVNNNAVCSCLEGLVGAPPSCRGCSVSADCKLEKTCTSQKCVDPCVGICGQDALCVVVNHNPICSCPEGKTGDPFSKCN